MSLKVSGERLLREALADAMDRDLADVPPREQLEQQHRFSKKFVRRMKRLATAVKDGQETRGGRGASGEAGRRMDEKRRVGAKTPAGEPGGSKSRSADFRGLGAAAKRYGGLAAAFLCVVGLAAVVGVMSQSFRMGSSSADGSATDAAMPEEAWDDAAADTAASEEAAEESPAAAEDDAAPEDTGDTVAEEPGEAAPERTDADDGAPDGIADSGSSDDEKGETPPGGQEALAPGWQEQLLIESAKADELVSWHLNMIYDDGSIGLLSESVLSPGENGSDRQPLYVSAVFEVYYEQSPDEWERVYRTKRTRDDCSGRASWDEWYALDELNMTRAGTYRLVRQVNSYRQVLQLTLDER